MLQGKEEVRKRVTETEGEEEAMSPPPDPTGGESTYPGSGAGRLPQGSGADEPQPPPRVRSPSSNTAAGCRAKAVALIKHSAPADPPQSVLGVGVTDIFHAPGPSRTQGDGYDLLAGRWSCRQTPADAGEID
ncbi:unnamed protein product [Pleuronectes platessa]|uniref:Uncharacterized protein n=1 Tax=Pleuronectes platessa TaxID=8262 RepID=A0A9N7UQG8_PLEPL|nr:unnamed protein product [Pleuronectes platessa]